MSLLECEYCHKIFNNIEGQKICPECSKELDGIYKRIRKYMYTVHEHVTAAKIVDALDVPEKAVEYLIRDDRLILDQNQKAAGKCRICGAPTDGDILCRECRKKFSDSMQKFHQEQTREHEVQAKRPGAAHPLARIKEEKFPLSGAPHPIKRSRDD